MAFSACCSLNNLFPPPPNPLPVSNTPKLPCSHKEGTWQNRCLFGLTCAIIGLELGNFAAQDQRPAVAMELQSESSRTVRVQRWSDRRACQPWRANSLETIVPENLPRPSARRRWEATGFPQAAPAPPVGAAAVVGAKSCFTL